MSRIAMGNNIVLVSLLKNKRDRYYSFKRALLKYVAVGMQAIAVGAADHICRGEMKEGDPLINILVDWLVKLHRRTAKFVKEL